MRHTLTILILLITLFQGLSQQLTNEQKKSIVERHNFYRAIVGADSLVWSDNLEEEAEKCAEYMAEKPLLKCETSYGMNYYKYIDTIGVDSIVDIWAREQTLYYGQPITSENILYLSHYSQIIWKDTRQIGCALKKNKAGVLIFVCIYNPKGNIRGDKPTK